jgi:hypothetical protein
MKQCIGRLVIWLAAMQMMVASQPVTSLKTVRAMAPLEARQGRAVELEATVLYADTAKGEMVVDDGSASSYVSIKVASIKGVATGLQTGSRVGIVGRTVHFGLFPHVAADAITVTGTAPLPEPYRPAADELFQPSLDSDWVEVPAVVTGVETGGLGYTMVVEVFGLEFKADVPPTPDADRRVAALMQRPEQIEFFLRLYGLWEGIIDIPPPPRPPFDIETFEPIEPPWQAIKEWITDDEPDLSWFNQPRKPSEPDPDRFDQTSTWKAPEVPLDDGRILVLEYT